ncbi:MAG TPA: DUF1499 domain-containing protein [Candidatus Binataceae bacterium]|nr:DUF1499 domain-containing protein [Candidatus Binataceae bacterium]
MIPAWLSTFDAILAVLLVGLGVVGAHMGVIPPMTGFLAFLLSFVIAILAVLLGLLGLARTSAPQRRPGRPKAVAGIVLGLLVAVPVGFTMWRWMSMPYPEINDITTDYANPPEFVKPPELSPDSMKYDRGKFEPVQSKEYPKLDPLRLDEKPDDAFAKVSAAAHTMPGWQIVDDDRTTRTIEGVETSYLFRFRDDFVIQVRPGPDANSSLVEMRSRSRDGTGDFGVNYQRIKAFFAMLKPGGDAGTASPS